MRSLPLPRLTLISNLLSWLVSRLMSSLYDNGLSCGMRPGSIALIVVI